MNALEQVRFRSGSVYTPAGAAPDQGLSVNFAANGNASAGVGGSVQASGVLILIILGIVVASHLVAR